MRFLFLIVSVSIMSFAQVKNENKLPTPHTIKEHKNTEQLSEKERAYQAYLAKLEEENQKLEDDGFCSCNND
mgnify:CR=1 FL=1